MIENDCWLAWCSKSGTSVWLSGQKSLVTSAEGPWNKGRGYCWARRYGEGRRSVWPLSPWGNFFLYLHNGGVSGNTSFLGLKTHPPLPRRARIYLLGFYWINTLYEKSRVKVTSYFRLHGLRQRCGMPLFLIDFYMEKTCGRSTVGRRREVSNRFIGIRGKTIWIK